MVKKTTKQEKATQKSKAHKADDVKETVKDWVDKFWEEWKKTIGKVEKRWKESSSSEKASKIIGIIFLWIALRLLWGIIVWIAFLIAWILWITSFFVESKKK